MESTRLVIAALLLGVLLISTTCLHSCTAARVLTDPTQQAQAAISASLASARNVSATVSALAKSGGLKPREAAAVNDCMVTVSDSVDELRRSLQSHLRSNAGGSKSSSGLMGDRLKNVQTWVSAALTDETTCMDGFDEAKDGEVKRAVRAQIVKVAQLISNALAILSNIVIKH